MNKELVKISMLQAKLMWGTQLILVVQSSTYPYQTIQNTMRVNK